MLRLCIGVFVSLQALVLQAAPTFDKSYSEKVAVFEYLRGNKDQAMLELAKDSGLALGETNHVNRELFRTEQLQQTLANNLVGNLPVLIGDKLWLDISELRRQQGDCEGALLALLNLKQLSTEMDHRQRFQRVSCMLQQKVDATVLVAAERVAIAAQGEGSEQTSIWLAYIYNNLAVAAQQIKQPLLAQAYFKRAMQHTGNTEEGRSLQSYLTLNLAYSYFGANRFDFAQASFSELREDTEWLDQGLLGLGWSAYKNNQPGLALEAWRQLVKLPFKSINVYEGYLAIPFAFERQNAFFEALAGYEQAIKRYLDVIEQIDELSEGLLIEDIHKHAIAFNREGETYVEPLHPLLVHAYAQSSFQNVITTIGATAKFVNRLSELENQLMRVVEIRQVASMQADNKAHRIEQNEQAIDAQFVAITEKLDATAEILLQIAVDSAVAEDPIRKTYRVYAGLRENVDRHTPTNKDLQRIRGVLIGQLQENNALFQNTNPRVIALLKQFTRANQVYQAHMSVKSQLPSLNHVDQQVYLLQQKLTKAKGLVKKVQSDAEELLLGMTVEALAQQKQQLTLFEDQARISAARISEEFYQQGGERLWR